MSMSKTVSILVCGVIGSIISFGAGFALAVLSGYESAGLLWARLSPRSLRLLRAQRRAVRLCGTGSRGAARHVAPRVVCPYGYYYYPAYGRCLPA
jgi:hypothetical protein